MRCFRMLSALRSDQDESTIAMLHAGHRARPARLLSEDHCHGQPLNNRVRFRTFGTLSLERRRRLAAGGVALHTASTFSSGAAPISWRHGMDLSRNAFSYQRPLQRRRQGVGR